MGTALKLRLIEQLYDGAESALGMNRALGDIAAALGATGAHSLLLERGALVESHTHGATPETFTDYETHWMHHDPRLVAAVRGLGRIVTDEEVMAPTDFERSEFYNEALRPVGVRYTLLASAEVAPGLLLAQAYMRPPNRRGFALEDAQFLEAFLPHLRRAMHLRQLVTSLRSGVSDLERALDLVPTPLAIVDARGHLVCANAAAVRLLDRSDGLTRGSEGLTSTVAADAARLAGLIAKVARQAEGSRGSVLQPTLDSISLKRRTGSALGLHALPLRPVSAIREEGHRAARVLLVLHDPDAVSRLNPSRIMVRYGLTATEALLAASLGQGRTLAEFAAERGCAEETARTHLKRVLAKTGARRQSDLVRLLLGDLGLQLDGLR